MARYSVKFDLSLANDIRKQVKGQGFFIVLIMLTTSIVDANDIRTTASQQAEYMRSISKRLLTHNPIARLTSDVIDLRTSPAFTVYE